MVARDQAVAREVVADAIGERGGPGLAIVEPIDQPRRGLEVRDELAIGAVQLGPDQCGRREVEVLADECAPRGAVRIVRRVGHQAAAAERLGLGRDDHVVGDLEGRGERAVLDPASFARVPQERHDLVGIDLVVRVGVGDPEHRLVAADRVAVEVGARQPRVAVACRLRRVARTVRVASGDQREHERDAHGGHAEAAGERRSITIPASTVATISQPEAWNVGTVVTIPSTSS